MYTNVRFKMFWLDDASSKFHILLPMLTNSSNWNWPLIILISLSQWLFYRLPLLKVNKKLILANIFPYEFFERLQEPNKAFWIELSLGSGATLLLLLSTHSRLFEWHSGKLTGNWLYSVIITPYAIVLTNCCHMIFKAENHPSCYWEKLFFCWECVIFLFTMYILCHTHWDFCQKFHSSFALKYFFLLFLNQ